MALDALASAQSYRRSDFQATLPGRVAELRDQEIDEGTHPWRHQPALRHDRADRGGGETTIGQHHPQPAGAQIVGDVPQGMRGDAFAGDGSITQQFAIVAFEPALHAYRMFFALCIVQAPDVFTSAAAE